MVVVKGWFMKLLPPWKLEVAGCIVLVGPFIPAACGRGIEKIRRFSIGAIDIRNLEQASSGCYLRKPEVERLVQTGALLINRQTVPLTRNRGLNLGLFQKPPSSPILRDWRPPFRSRATRFRISESLCRSSSINPSIVSSMFTWSLLKRSSGFSLKRL